MPENSKKRIVLNVISSAFQVIVTGIVFFFVYRILIHDLGVKLLGVWSLIIATTSISNLANLGFSSALVKFVAEYNARGESSEINKLLYTSFISMIFLFFVVVIIVFFLAYLFIGKIVEAQYVKVALNVLPISLLSLFVNSMGGVFTSALEGFQKNYIRNLIYSFTAICYLIMTILLIPEYGLVGLAFSQVMQAVLITLLSYYFLIKKCRTFGFSNSNWDYIMFKKLFKYGIKIQFISVSQMLIDPITKIMISKFSGMTTLGFYEMASRLIIQLRQIIVNMNQVTIPIVSHYFETDKSAIKYIYERGFSFIIFIVFPLVSGIILFTPYLSGIWIGHIEPIFINCSNILALSMLINVLCSPAYFNSFGEGELNGVLIMNIIIFSLNAFLGIILGISFPVYGVVIAWGIATAIGSIFLIYHYQSRKGFSFSNLLKSYDYIIIISAVVFTLLTRFIFLDISESMRYSSISLICFLLAYLAFFVPVAYFNRNFKFFNPRQYFQKEIPE